MYTPPTTKLDHQETPWWSHNQVYRSDTPYPRPSDPSEPPQPSNVILLNRTRLPPHCLINSESVLDGSGREPSHFYPFTTAPEPFLRSSQAIHTIEDVNNRLPYKNAMASGTDEENSFRITSEKHVSFDLEFDEKMGSNKAYTNYKLAFDCRTCRGQFGRRELIARHLTHDYRPNQISLKGLARRAERYYKGEISKTISDIQKAKDDFLRQVGIVQEKIERRCQPVMFGQLWKAEFLRILTDITASLLLSWTRQEEDCYRYLKQWGGEKLEAKSLREISGAVIQVSRDWEKVRYVESCEVDITGPGTGKLGLGQITLSPSPSKTTVTLDGKSVVNELNTCTVTVQDAIGNIVNEGKEYEISAVLVDPEDNPMDLTIENKKNGLFCIKYFPTATGHHTLSVTLNSIPISNQAIDIDVKDKTRPSITVFGEPGAGDSQFARPWGVCADGYGNIYVVDRSNHRIQVFDEKGGFIRKFGGEGSGPGQFKVPTGIAVDMCQRLVIADKDNHRIQLLRSDGTYIRHFGQFESEEESLHYPWDVAVDRNGHIAVTEGLKHRVTLFNDLGTKLGVCIFTREMHLDFPRGISSLPDGSFLVTDFNQHKIVLLNEDLEPVSTLGSKGEKADEFNRPQGIAVSGDGLFVVSDCKNQRIKLFVGDSLQKVITEEFECIQGVAFHPNGSLIVVDKDKCQVKILSFENVISVLPSVSVCRFSADSRDL